MLNKNILISGAGIAGLTLAYWLKNFGFNPTIIEQAPKLREGGYAIDFFGAGFDVAEKMKILPDLQKVDLKIQELIFVDKNNKRRGGLSVFKIGKLVNNRYFNLLRSDLSKVIYNHLDKDIEFIFGDAITQIVQTADNATVTLKSGNVRTFDLIVGADGLHSVVRSLTFGDESQFEKYYGYYASSFTIENYLQNDNAFYSYNLPGKQVSIYALKGNKLTTLFIFTSPQKISYSHHEIEKQKEILRNEYGDMAWECPSLLAKLDSAPDFYFDSVSQIRMSQWSKGRITLAGDACDCPSLLSGQGSTLAMVGAYILAGELKKAGGDYKIAFRQYENSFKPLIDDKQKLAQSFAGSLVPKSNFGIWVRNTFSNAMFSSLLSKWFVKKYMTDRIELKEY
ncbi:FAD-dependent monooxygenase [Solitalea koreensis]|uniref:2-polyprenyl-6-methoxyphenol hydroxylase n=1 Tax=Solitalea koreensis TaxID=543615 RepID=A0A521ADF5_9SPHI|nr:FAD-dependent monooxygenase [Solitalea koreensis]SMO32845.1 2-polyprenyl-6-methoxyphenol hydroxylase [Solitalea koreensis]